MGYEQEHAIIVLGSYERPESNQHWTDFAHENAVRICERRCPITEVVDAVINNKRSFAVLPDGSKDGWEVSDDGNKARAEFVAWLEQQAYGDGSSPLTWVEVQFGDDEHDSRVLRHSDEPNGTEY